MKGAGFPFYTELIAMNIELPDSIPILHFRVVLLSPRTRLSLSLSLVAILPALGIVDSEEASLVSCIQLGVHASIGGRVL